MWPGLWGWFGLWIRFLPVPLCPHPAAGTPPPLPPLTPVRACVRRQHLPAPRTPHPAPFSPQSSNNVFTVPSQHNASGSRATCVKEVKDTAINPYVHKSPTTNPAVGVILLILSASCLSARTPHGGASYVPRSKRNRPDRRPSMLARLFHSMIERYTNATEVTRVAYSCEGDR